MASAVVMWVPMFLSFSMAMFRSSILRLAVASTTKWTCRLEGKEDFNLGKAN